MVMRGVGSSGLWRQWVISMLGENLQPGAPHAHFDFAVVAGELLRSVIAQRVLVASLHGDAGGGVRASVEAVGNIHAWRKPPARGAARALRFRGSCWRVAAECYSPACTGCEPPW